MTNVGEAVRGLLRGCAREPASVYTGVVEPGAPPGNKVGKFAWHWRPNLPGAGIRGGADSRSAGIDPPAPLAETGSECRHLAWKPSEALTG